MANYGWNVNGLKCSLNDGNENGEKFDFSLVDLAPEEVREELAEILNRPKMEKVRLVLFHGMKQKSADSANTTPAEEKFRVIKTELERLLNPSENFNAVRGTGTGSSAIPAACKEFGALISSQLQNAWKRAKKAIVMEIDSEKLDAFCTEKVFNAKPETKDGKAVTKAQWKTAASDVYADLLMADLSDFNECKFD